MISLNIDRKIICRLKARDEEAFDIIYYEYVNLIFHVIYSIVENKHDAEDLTQDTFIKMMSSVDIIDEKKNFKYWLITIAKNLAQDFLKKKKMVLDNDVIDNTLENSVNKRQSDFYEMLEQYRGIINKDEFNIITLRIFYNLHFKDIAYIFDTTESTVNNIYHRGMAKIRRR